MAAVGVRSRTRLDAEAIAAGDRLLAIGCFGVGTNQVDLDAARSRGIPVFNSPFANTRSVAELVIGEGRRSRSLQVSLRYQTYTGDPTDTVTSRGAAYL